MFLCSLNECVYQYDFVRAALEQLVWCKIYGSRLKTILIPIDVLSPNIINGKLIIKALNRLLYLCEILIFYLYNWLGNSIQFESSWLAFAWELLNASDVSFQREVLLLMFYLFLFLSALSLLKCISLMSQGWF